MTEANLPPPLVPADVDLRSFEYMKIDVRRLLTSETWMLGTGDECKAALTLWLESWHQVPAGSLPDNEQMLAHLSQCSTWKKSRTHALRGWVKCSDGRLYHPVIAEKVRDAWQYKLAQKARTEAARLARQQQRRLQAARDYVTDNVTERVTDSVTESVTDNVTDSVTESKGDKRILRTEEQPPLPPLRGGPATGSNGKHRRRQRQPQTPCPDDFALTPDMLKFATDLGVPAERIHPETERFISHHAAKGNVFADWPQAWANWMRKAVEIGWQQR